MNTQRWHRIQALFDPALQLPTSERAGFLDDACAGDSGLYRDLTALLASSRTASHALRKAIAAEVRRFASDVASAQLGRRIGPYRLTKLLGEGGMGAVYLAERDDAQFAQSVAIKILRHAVSSPGTIARFRDERQILAALEHPNIVRLLDGGSTDDGLPYLVMEYIEGATLTSYAEHRQLSVRARVELVLRVCSALQYAHQNLVVHRDIKPSNILVDIDGTAKILDFGIAKLLAPATSFQLEARTRTGFAMFTPEYASPEQARGDAVSTATDVYSIGLVLYELLTGQQPFREAVGLEMLRMICEVDPPRPSTVAPHARRRELAVDLDNIILKALHKEPARRYSSMEQFAEDLRRWLDGLPVAARTSTFGYRACKFVGRNKLVVAAAALVIITLLAATVVSLRQARRADEQATRAEAEARNAIDAVARARVEQARAEREAERARLAEDRALMENSKFKAEQAARAAAEAMVKAKSSELELNQGQVQILLARLVQAKLVADEEWSQATKVHQAAQATLETARNEFEQAADLRRKAFDDRQKSIIDRLRPWHPPVLLPAKPIREVTLTSPARE